ncbi:unnamed protein product, partial [Ceratitis capitata]
KLWEPTHSNYPKKIIQSCLGIVNTSIFTWDTLNSEQLGINKRNCDIISHQTSGISKRNIPAWRKHYTTGLYSNAKNNCPVSWEMLKE